MAAPRFSAISQPTDPSDEALLSWTDEPSWRETFVLTFEKLAEKPNHSESLLKHLFDSRVVKKSPAGKSSAMQLLAELIIDPYISLTAEIRMKMRQQCWLWAINSKDNFDAPFHFLFRTENIERTLLSEHSGELDKTWRAAGLTYSDLEKRALHLNLSGCVNLSDLKPVAKLLNLQKLILSECSNIKTLRPLASCKKLQSLSIAGCRKISDLAPLVKMKELQNLDIQGCTQIANISPLAKLKELRYLSLNAYKHDYLWPLAEARNLEDLVLNGAAGDIDLSPLSTLHNLRALHLHGFKGDVDTTPLVGLSTHLHICGAGSNKISFPPEFGGEKFRKTVRSDKR